MHLDKILHCFENNFCCYQVIQKKRKIIFNLECVGIQLWLHDHRRFFFPPYGSMWGIFAKRKRNTWLAFLAYIASSPGTQPHFSLLAPSLFFFFNTIIASSFYVPTLVLFVSPRAECGPSHKKFFFFLTAVIRVSALTVCCVCVYGSASLAVLQPSARLAKRKWIHYHTEKKVKIIYIYIYTSFPLNWHFYFFARLLLLFCFVFVCACL